MVQELKESREKLEIRAAKIITDAASEILKLKERAVLGICGGTSVAGIFEHLKKEPINWQKVHIFLVDERLVGIDDKDSNYRLAKESFIDSLIRTGKLPLSNNHPFIYDPEADDYGIKAYADELKEVGGKLDILLLSSGEDGHIGALYPKHHSVKNPADFFLYMHDSPKPPQSRMTASRKLLERSDTAIVLFFGQGKKKAYNNFLNDRITVNDCPAKIIENIPNAFVLTDL